MHYVQQIIYCKGLSAFGHSEKIKRNSMWKILLILISLVWFDVMLQDLLAIYQQNSLTKNALTYTYKLQVYPGGIPICCSWKCVHVHNFCPLLLSVVVILSV